MTLGLGRGGVVPLERRMWRRRAGSGVWGWSLKGGGAQLPVIIGTPGERELSGSFVPHLWPVEVELSFFFWPVSFRRGTK